MTGLRALAFLGVALALSSSSRAAPPPSPDRMAWEVFAQMVAPAGMPGAKAVAFETWASDADLYSATPRWPSRGSKLLTRSLAAVAEDRAVHALAAPGCLPRDGAAGNFPPGACIGEEVQHNRPVFDYILANGLYSKAGLVKAFAGGKPIDFPGDAVVVKADWVLVSDILRWQPATYKTADAVRRAYYTNRATLNGRSGEYALAGLSVQSKQARDWVWSTFEQRSNPGRCDVIGCHDDFGAAAADVAPRPAANTDYGPCAKTPALRALLASRGSDPVWDNYCLKGTQVRFVTPTGQPTLLANSVIERMNKGVAVQQTSCITCHAYASFDRAGLPNFAALQPPPKNGVPQPPPTGAVQAALLQGYKQNDFLWGVIAAAP
ncbi:MAG TPA: hypothetical protein VNU97_19855 [Rhizomicrobium sp.]|nr:hypothetical protein [Rhizomicrobium sp.]